MQELADKLDRSVEQTAEAIIRIAVSGMFQEVSGMVSRFGIDPREFARLYLAPERPVAEGQAW